MELKQRYGRIVPVRPLAMDLGKALKFINLSIAVLLLLVLGATYWLVYRPLPATSGQISAPVSAKATI